MSRPFLPLLVGEVGPQVRVRGVPSPDKSQPLTLASLDLSPAGRGGEAVS